MKRMLTLLIAMHFMVLAFGNAGTASGEKGLKEDRANLEKALKSMKFVLIQPGMFMMGSPPDEAQRRSNETMHKVTITKPFYMQATEVTQAQWKAVMGENPSKFTDCGGGCPVEQVSWEDVQIFINKLNLLSGRKYRLPTEAEWEYCARFDGQQAVRKYVWGEGFPPPDQSGNFADAAARGLLNSVLSGYQDGYSAAAPTARFPPNPLGLFDLGGNAAEWCHDAYTIHPYEPDAVYTDPVGPENGSLHVIRGASWQDAAMTVLRTAYRGYGDKGRDNVGFRICRYAE